MRHFDWLGPKREEELFARRPRPFSEREGRLNLACGMGAVLYTPASLDDLADKAGVLREQGVLSWVLCLEDSIADTDLKMAEENVSRLLREIHNGACEGPPLVFLRARGPRHMQEILARLDYAVDALTGFVLPKFRLSEGPEYLKILNNVRSPQRLYVMPTLENTAVAYSETRISELLELRRFLLQYRERILALRIGAMDLAGLFGIRRRRETSAIADPVLGPIIADIVNIFCRDDELPVAAPLTDDLLPSVTRKGEQQDKGALAEFLNVLNIERECGFTGKTAVHPVQVPYIHAAQVVLEEEFRDALLALRTQDGGIDRGWTDRLIEGRPQKTWARRVLRRSRLFGVLREGRSVSDVWR